MNVFIVIGEFYLDEDSWWVEIVIGEFVGFDFEVECFMIDEELNIFCLVDEV